MGAPIEGGCLCGHIRYSVPEKPLRITICHCTFCQRATGSDRLIEPIYERRDLSFTKGTPRIFTTVSAGSGHEVHVHFCPECGTKLALTFGRWPDRAGLFRGTLDDPGRIVPDPGTARVIFASEAPPGAILPGGVEIYARHVEDLAGRAEPSETLPSPRTV